MIAIAPMMGYTNRHCRYLFRLLSKHTELYTEMVTALALTNGNPERLLAYSAAEKPLVLQVGGSDPILLAHTAALAEEYGFSAINLNAGCPSDRVKQGNFGACLMTQPDLVVDCLAAMRVACQIPVTIKTRIGVDEQDSYDFLQNFVARIAEVSIDTFIIHARKAWLNGLSPKQNRTVPPLTYSTVYRLKQDFPQLKIIINGGVQSIADIDKHLQHVDGVMLGREAIRHPYLVAEFDQHYFDEKKIPSREAVIADYFNYARVQWHQGESKSLLLKPLFAIYTGQPGAKRWRRELFDRFDALV